MLRITALEGENHFESLREEWCGLVERSSTATPFQTWEWHSTWFKHFGFGSSPIFLLAYSDSTLVGIFPLTKRKRLFGTHWYSMGVGPSDYLNPLIASGYEPLAIAAFDDFLAQVKRKSQVDLHQLRSATVTESLSADQNWDQATCLVLELPSNFKDYLKTLSKSLRSDIQKGLKLGDSYSIQYASPSNVRAVFGLFLELHRARWRRRGLPGAFLGRTLRFQLEWTQIAADNGWLTISVLRQNSRPIAALYTMQFKETVYFYQLGVDTTVKGISPGTTLIANSIRQAIDRQAKFFDFMRGDEPYKHRWKPNSSYVNHRLIYRRVGILGTASFKWTEFIWRVECAIRAKVEGKGLL